ncbi:hypothetical protein V7S43_007081 [Phytophthora oleae]|uniref:Uncharacterized protein n=1 Tax=Phytophthora oleae TaxID=2107226 RepID=A0ABD3FPI0_9STRA
MGATLSSVPLQPALEPAALLTTEAGVIIRIPDPAGGTSTYEHNSRISAAPLKMVAEESQMKKQEAHVAAVVRPGERNQALKGRILYLKKVAGSSSKQVEV